MKWIQVLLNHGVDPVTNRTILPRATYDMVTASHSIVSPAPSQSWFSPETYGLGWFVKSYQGHNVVTHLGAIPGFSVEMFFLPESGLGVVVLANSAAKHQQELAICYRIIEDYLGLERKESERLLAEPKDNMVQREGHKTGNTPSPMSLPLNKYAGTYYDPGYGNVTLCAPSLAPPESCMPVLKAWSFFENTTDVTRPVLYAAWPSVWVSHARLLHEDGDRFHLSATYLFPGGYGRDKSPFHSDVTPETVALAEFLVEVGEEGMEVKGLALNGLVGEKTEQQRIGGTMEETAEIWLRKI